MSNNGASSSAFHLACDDLSPCLVLVKVNRFYIFGYFITVPFSSHDGYAYCDDAWIFSITDGTKRKPMKFLLNPEKKEYAFYQSKGSPGFISGYYG